MILATDLGYGDTTDLRSALDEIGRMLGSYMAKIRNDRT